MTDLNLGLLGLLVIVVLILLVTTTHKNNGAKMIVFFLAILFSADNVYALLTIDAPRAVYEGTAAKVRIKGEYANAHKWEAIFLRRVYKFFVDGNDAIAIIAVPLNEPAGNRVIAFENDLREIRRLIEIKKKMFPSSVVTFPQLSAAERERNDKERAEILKITGIYSEGHNYRPRQFYWPLERGGCDVTSPFGKKRLNKKNELIGRHWGVDCRAKEGDFVHAVSAGVVRFAGETLLGGKTVIIDHGFGVFSVYMHLLGIYVGVGEEINGWNVIGIAGATGRASGPNLHFGIRVNGIDVDPIEFLKLGGAK